jgi:F-type H+-transporting ATPase subunit delta
MVRFALYSPIISKFDKLKLVKNFVEKFEFENIVNQFFKVIIKNSRFQILSLVVNEYQHLLNESKGIKVVIVESVNPPNKKIISVIKEYLENKLEKIIEVSTIQNKSLLGGAIIKYDSFLYDYSFEGAINRAAKLARIAKI